MVDAPIILVGDIDKGGVFASIYGTVMLLEPEEQKRIKGYIINKFRGDVEILKPGLDMFYDKLPIPCLGVIPFMTHRIDDEDSVTERFFSRKEGQLKIGVIRLPYMSNFTDFTSLEIEEDAAVYYIDDTESEEMDLLILPGSKNTLKDMRYLQNNGFNSMIYKAHKKGTPIIGICGGYQMLGMTIEDPSNIESESSSINGLGLLNCHTVIQKEKVTTQIEGRFLHKDYRDLKIEGYEIHMGETYLAEGTVPVIQLADGRYDGAVNEKGNVFGTYLHGIFDNDSFRNKLLNQFREVKGLKQSSATSYQAFKEKEYDQLAATVRASVDITAIKEIMGVSQ